MKNNLLFDFSVNKENKTILVRKDFDAKLNLVWNAWTLPELLDKWWAPIPFQNKTILMNFIEGGIWHYAMISPKGEKYYSKAYFKKIEDLKMFSYKDFFCNEKGENLLEMPSINWKISFIPNFDVTTVNVALDFDSLEQLENTIKMGFKEGFTTGLNQLDKLLQ